MRETGHVRHEREFYTPQLALTAVNDFIGEACQEAGVSPGHVYKSVIAGNTCTHRVFLGVDVSYVGLAPHTPVVRESQVVPAGEQPLKGAPNAIFVNAMNLEEDESVTVAL